VQTTFAVWRAESGIAVTEVCRKMQVSEQTFYRWKKKLLGNASDLRVLIEPCGNCPPSGDCLADLNDDGVVNFSDQFILLANWG